MDEYDQFKEAINVITYQSINNCKIFLIMFSFLALLWHHNRQARWRSWYKPIIMLKKWQTTVVYHFFTLAYIMTFPTLRLVSEMDQSSNAIRYFLHCLRIVKRIAVMWEIEFLYYKQLLILNYNVIYMGIYTISIFLAYDFIISVNLKSQFI